MTRSGLALLIVVGVLGVLAMLAVAFVAIAQLERSASQQRTNATRALLLARSGLEDALARISLGQDPAYGGEDWDASGALDGLELSNDVFGPGMLDTAACPLRHALRPSFFAADSLGKPLLLEVEGRQKGYSGRLAGDLRQEGNTYALKVEDVASRVYVNGGDLGASSADTSMDGPNGFLVRLLDNLDEAVTGGTTLGVELVGARPPGGYRSMAELKAALGDVRFAPFRSYLTRTAWVDPQVVKPQPMEARPDRFLDIDDAHKAGAGMPGSGTEADPWKASFGPCGIVDTTVYTYGWERNTLYAWRQLRLGPVTREPRAPVSVNTAPEPVLVAVFRGLKGTYVEVWDGSAGWDGGFGWAVPLTGPAVTYAYPSQDTEETPWFRTRVDYGMPYSAIATGTGGQPRPKYAPSSYVKPPPGNPQPLPCVAPLGRLKESSPISLAQAQALARQIRDRLRQKGPFRTWAEFGAFVDALPRWEDLDDDLQLDGAPYGVASGDTRRMYRREDANSDGVMNREIFQVSSGGWTSGIAWVDLGLTPLGAGQVPGLSFVQKDVLKAMANPNTDLNDFNPDANRWKEVDKTDLAGIPAGAPSYVHTTELALDAPGYVELRALGRVLDARGRLMAQRQAGVCARLWDLFRQTTQADFMQAWRDGTPIGQVFSGPPAPYPLAGGAAQTLVSYPEPQQIETGPAADAAYDGQIGLGLVGTLSGPADRLKADLFDSLDGQGVNAGAVPDAWGPFRTPLVQSGPRVGNLFPDGLYSEKDATLKYPVASNFDDRQASSPIGGLVTSTYVFYIDFWVKPNWFPEASPRPHALISLARAVLPKTVGAYTFSPLDFSQGLLPPTNSGFAARPLGLFFVPARNNVSISQMGPYIHTTASTLGAGWSARSLLWGATHSLYTSDAVNRRGQGYPVPSMGPGVIQDFPVGRLQAHRWTHVAAIAKTGQTDNAGVKNMGSRLVLGGAAASYAGGGGLVGGIGRIQDPLTAVHVSSTGTEPNHLRFGAVAGEHYLNYVADATFADVQTGGLSVSNDEASGLPVLDAYESAFKGLGPARVGRYYKEGDYLGDGAVYVSPPLPRLRFRRVTWTEIPADLWFDEKFNGTSSTGSDGWLDTLANDRFGAGGVPGPNGLRDVRVDLRVWDDMGTPSQADDVEVASFSDGGGPNLLPAPRAPGSRFYYKAVFVNEWNAATRDNTPLDVTPFLDDVTFYRLPAGGVQVLDWIPEGDLE